MLESPDSCRCKLSFKMAVSRPGVEVNTSLVNKFPKPEMSSLFYQTNLHSDFTHLFVSIFYPRFLFFLSHLHRLSLFSFLSVILGVVHSVLKAVR